MLLTDTVISAFTLIKIRARAALATGDSTEAITAAVREALARESALLRRQLRAFPEAKLYNSRVAHLMRERRAQLRRDMKEARLRARQALDQREQALRDELKSRKQKS